MAANCRAVVPRRRDKFGVVMINVHRLARHIRLPAALVVAAGMVAAGSSAASAAQCVSWAGIPPANPSSSDNTFGAVAVRSPCDAWAVGSDRGSGGSFHTLIEHWNGTRWTVMLSSNPGGFNRDSFLAGVAAASSGHAWAVGYYDDGTAGQTLIEAPNNGLWKQVPSANPGGPNQPNVLLAAAATSARNAWAVGYYSKGIGFATLIEHWNGTTWRQVPSPNPSTVNNELLGIAAPSAKDAWAVGQYADSSNKFQTLILHWNGSVWKRVRSPNPAGSGSSHSLTAVAATSSTNAWAVGQFDPGSGFRPLIEHWNGRAWKSVPAPSPGPASVAVLNGVTALSARGAWAVGAYTSLNTNHTLIEHWNGTRWSLAPSPSLGISATLTSVSSSGNTVWAAGYYENGGPDLTLAAHCC